MEGQFPIEKIKKRFIFLKKENFGKAELFVLEEIFEI